VGKPTEVTSHGKKLRVGRQTVLIQLAQRKESGPGARKSATGARPLAEQGEVGGRKEDGKNN